MQGGNYYGNTQHFSLERAVDLTVAHLDHDKALCQSRAAFGRPHQGIRILSSKKGAIPNEQNECSCSVKRDPQKSTSRKDRHPSVPALLTLSPRRVTALL